MHQLLTGYLEDLLEGRSVPPAVDEHLKMCSPCASALELIRAQQRGFHLLRAEAEPAPGFYQRVMERIERQARPSIWSLFGESLFARRLAYASIAAGLLLTAVVFSDRQQNSGSELAANSAEVVMAADTTAPVPVGMNPEQDREAVFVQLATFGE